MKKIDLAIPAIDILLLLLIMLLLGLFAIRYDANKGIGNKSFIPINILISADSKLIKKLDTPEFFAIILNGQQINTIHYINDNEVKSYTFSAMNELSKFIEDNNDTKTPYVIYETGDNKYLADIIRIFIKQKIPIGIAQVK